MGRETTGFGRYYALVIGNRDYKHLDNLKTPLNDAREVAKVLKDEYGFDHVDLMLNASRRKIMDSILDWCDGGILQEDDNLLIYYAGHGRLDSQGKFGYWQPVDARDRETDWISTFWVTEKLKAAKAKHVLVIADSCYAGSLLMRGNRIPPFDGINRGEWLYRMYMGRSRTALTSGGKDEKVQDAGEDGHSVFAQAFLEVLRKNKEILDGNRLFDTLKITVVDIALQTPRYNYIPGTGENSGDFLLVPKEILRKNLRLSVDVFRGTSPAIQPVGADFMATKNVRIRRQPQFTSQQVGMLKKGDAIWVVGEVKEQPWYLVDCGKGQQEQGYIYSSYLQEKTGGKVRGKSREGTAVAAAKRTESPVSRKMPQKDKKIGQYIDHGDGTVTDTKTGLIWKRCSEGLSGDNCERGKAEEYEFDDAVKRFKIVAYAGYSDWRLPTIDELKTLVYCSDGGNKGGFCNDMSEQPTINELAFPNTKATFFCSGNPSVHVSDNSLCVNFSNGDPYPNVEGRNIDCAVRLVSLGKIQYVDNSDGTITDTKNGLMWKRCSEGLSGVNCEEGKAEEYEFDDAVKRFKTVAYAGYSDWRLPTIDELKTLVYCSKGKGKEGDCSSGSEAPTINQQAFPNTKASRFWSGSPAADSSGGAWGVFFNYGDSYIRNRFNACAVRLVRVGQ